MIVRLFFEMLKNYFATIKKMSTDEFITVYEALLRTLNAKFGTTQPLLKSHAAHWKRSQNKPKYVSFWWKHLGQHADLIERKDTTLFTMDLPPLLALDLQAIWWSGRLSRKSKDIVFMYLQRLLDIARPEDFKSQEVDLDGPPTTTSMPPGLTMDVFKNAMQITQKYTQAIESKELRPEDLNLARITRDIARSVDPSIDESKLEDMSRNMNQLLGGLNLDALLAQQQRTS